MIFFLPWEFKTKLQRSKDRPISKKKPGLIFALCCNYWMLINGLSSARVTWIPNSCLCVNLISLLHDKRQNAKNVAIDILKYLLVHRRASFEDLLVSKPARLDVLRGGFDKLLTGSLSCFFEWFQSSEQTVNKVLSRVLVSCGCSLLQDQQSSQK